MLRLMPYRLEWIASALLLSCLGLTAGCNRSESPATAATNGPEPGIVEEPAGDPLPADSAEQVMRDMADAYAKAASYSDRGKISFEVKEAGKDTFRHDPDCAVQFVRPNKLRMRMYGSLLVSDGKQIHAKVDDEHFQDDILEVDAPAELTLADIYRDGIVEAYLTRGIAGGSVQLMLLIGEKPLEALRDGASGLKLLDPEKIDNRWCHRVEATRDDGPLVFWIDQKTHVLRRIDYPTGELRKQLEAEGSPDEVMLRADFREAQLGGPVDDEAFAFEAPPRAKKVTAFNPRKLEPPPAAPSAQLGRAIADFTFKDLEGNDVTRESLAGKVVVLDFWATWCEPCGISLPNLQKVYHRYKDNDQVRFYAVNVDDREVADVNLLKAFEELKVSVPIVRAPIASREDAEKFMNSLGLTGLLPNLVLLGPDGLMQDNEVGLNEQLVVELPGRIEKLLAGGSLHEDAQVRYEQRMIEYQTAISTPPPDSGADGAMPNAEIAPRDEPAKLKISKLWSNAEIEQPGNLLVVQTEGAAPVILVNQGWRTVAELDGAGKVVASHALDLPPEGVVAYLRTGVDADGRRFFAGLASAQQQVHMFDETWKKVFSYPEATPNVAVADAVLTDLDGDKKLDLCVSYWDVAGVQRVSLEGQRVWSQRDQMQDVYRLTPTAADESGRAGLLCTNGGLRGALVLIDADGQNQKQISVGSRYVRLVASADLDSDGALEYCGLAPTPAGHESIVGFDLEGGELWEVPLAKGVNESPIELITTGKLTGDTVQWVVAGPDGAVLIIDANGQLVDSFHYGAALTGIATAQIDGAPALIVSTAEGVDAWKVETP
jgi:thiol-disulfide isomerase/thioredoxin